MVYVEGYWKVQVVCLIILVSIVAVLWNRGGSGYDQGANPTPTHTATYISEEFND